MKRYGDNLPTTQASEEELNTSHGRNVQVMYGGCGVRFGTFSRPMGQPSEPKSFDLLSFLRLRRNSVKENRE